MILRIKVAGPLERNIFFKIGSNNPDERYTRKAFADAYIAGIELRSDMQNRGCWTPEFLSLIGSNRMRIAEFRYLNRIISTIWPRY